MTKIYTSSKPISMGVGSGEQGDRAPSHWF